MATNRRFKLLNQRFPELDLKPYECLAIEDSFAGIAAAKRAQVPVLGVAHVYPYHMVHRRADWAIDHLFEFSLDWLKTLLRSRRTTHDAPRAGRSTIPVGIKPHR